MRKVHSRKRINTASLVALATAIPAIAHSAGDVQQTLPTITVTASQNQGYKVDRVSNSKKTQALINTPQTIAVIDKKVISEQGAGSLVQALQNTPGITMQLGENGNTSAGDTIQLRGFNIANSLYVDGIRDFGAITRDTFNIEQIEVVKGPAGSDAGRSTTSGYINTKTKVPTLGNSRSISTGYDTAEHARVTTDINQQLNGQSAFRLNGMWQKGNVTGRDYVTRDGYAFAPSIAVGLGTDLRAYAYSQHIKQDNVPDGGISTVGFEGFYDADPALRSAKMADMDNFYGRKDDYEKVDADMFTLKLEKDLAGGVLVENTTRYGKTTMNRIVTAIHTPRTNGSPSDPSKWTVDLRPQRIDRDNSILSNLTNAVFSFETFGVEHDLATGVELSLERQWNDSFSTTPPGGTSPTLPKNSLYNPDPNIDLTMTPLYHTGDNYGKTTISSIYAFDTLKFFGEQFNINAGIRIDNYKTEYTNSTIGSTSTTVTELTTKDTLFNWNLGLLLKPTIHSSVYVSYTNSLTPPGGDSFSLSTSTEQNANTPNVSPQETENFELGAKVDLLNGRLTLTSAIFHTENTGQFSKDAVTLAVTREGETRIIGAELGLVGKITDQWDVIAGVARTKTDVTSQISSRKSSTTNITTVTKTTGARFTPDLTATLWTTYALNKLKVGLGARYISDQKRAVTETLYETNHNTNTTTTPAPTPINMPVIPAYVVVDALVGYNFTPQTSIMLNVYNLADEVYASSLNYGGARISRGTPRSALLTLTHKF